MLDTLSHATRVLLDRPSPAVLTTYRKDGTASVSPVWFRFDQGNPEVVIAEDDVKLRHLERDPRCSLLIFETEHPFRGLAVEGRARLEPDLSNKVRLAIASRYLGPQVASRFVEQRNTSGLVLRVDATNVKEWDLSGVLPQD